MNTRKWQDVPEEEDDLDRQLAELDELEEEANENPELELLEDLADDDDEEAMEIELVDEVEEEQAPAEPAVAEKTEKKAPAQPTPKPQKSHSGLLDTGEGFALRLPKDAVQNILSSLEATPHDGFVPVVAFGPNGQIMLTFESENTKA